MARAAPGNIYEVNVLDKFAYIQYIRDLSEHSILARIYTTLYLKRPSNPTSIISGPSVRMFYPIDAALRKPALIVPIGSVPLLPVDLEPIKFRGANYFFEEGKGMRIVDPIGIFDVEYDWPQFQIASHASLLQYIAEANGLVAPRGGIISDDKSIPSDHAAWFLIFDNEENASRAGRLITSNILFKEFKWSVDRTDRAAWMLMIIGRPIAQPQEADKFLNSVALNLGGTYDGSELPL